MGCFNIIIDSRGIPYITTTGVNVSDNFVDLALGFRRIQPVGHLSIRIATPISADVESSLPVRLTLFGETRELTYADGTPVTAEDLEGTQFIDVFYDRWNALLVLTSVPQAPDA